MRGKFAVNGKKMSQVQFNAWLGEAVNKFMVCKLRDKGYTPAKIAEIMDVNENVILYYLKEN